MFARSGFRRIDVRNAGRTFRCLILTVCLLCVGSRSWADVIPPLGNSQAAGGVENAESQRLRPAIEAFQRGDADSFRVAYSMVAKEEEGFPAMEIFWAKLLLESGKGQESLSVVENYVRQNLDDPDAYILLGRIALATGRWTDGALQLQHAKKLIDEGKLKPSRKQFVEVPLIELQAQAAERRGQWKVAEAHYEQALKLKPDQFRYTWEIGKLRVLEGEVDQGRKLMSEAKEKSTDLPEASLSVAQILAETSTWRTETQKAEEIEKWFQQAIESDITNPVVYGAYFNWLLAAERAQDMASRYGELPEAVQQDRRLQFLRAIAARYLSDLETAESILVPLHQSDPEDPEIANQLALVLVESKDEAKRGRALQLSERNLRQLPNSETVVATAAWVQYRLGAGDVADRMLGELAKKVPLSAQSAYYASELLASRGLKDESLRMLKAAVDSPGIFPQRASAKAKLGE